MKKLACLLVVLMLTVSSTALADEILFRDIPWGSNVSDTISKLPEYSNSSGFDWDTRIDSWNSFLADYNKATNGRVISLSYHDEMTVAGYKMQSIDLRFLFSVDENSMICRDETEMELYGALYRFIVADMEMASSDLIGKLTEVYGAGESGVNEYGAKTITWHGDMSTGVCLEYSENGVFIWYGRTDASIIPRLDDALAREEAENAKGDVSGL